MTGGRTDLAGELLGMLLKDVEEYRDKLQRAFSEDKLETIAELAHTLAGGAAHPGPGMPMVLMSGWIAADSLDSDIRDGKLVS